MKEFYKQLHNTAKAAGINILTDEKCCEILAWLLVFGGGIEKAVFDCVLNTDIIVAQERLNLYGGERANAELLPLLRQKVKECEEHLQGKEYEWLHKLAKKYKVGIK
jgi:hypothetical protein